MKTKLMQGFQYVKIVVAAMPLFCFVIEGHYCAKLPLFVSNLVNNCKQSRSLYDTITYGARNNTVYEKSLTSD